jgi:hypothetical protein
VPGPAAQLFGEVALFGKVAPATAGVEHQQDPFECGPVIDPRPPARTPRHRAARNQRLDQFPEPILDSPLLLAVRHDRRRSTISY